MGFSTVVVKRLKHERLGSDIRTDSPPPLPVLDVRIGYRDVFNKYLGSIQ